MLGPAFIQSHIHINSQHSDLKQQLAPALFSGLAVHCNAKCGASIYECSHRRGAACTSHRASCVNTCFLYIHMFWLEHTWAQYFYLVKVIVFHTPSLALHLCLFHMSIQTKLASHSKFPRTTSLLNHKFAPHSNCHMCIVLKPMTHYHVSGPILRSTTICHKCPSS